MSTERVFFLSKRSPPKREPEDFKTTMQQTGGNTGNIFFMDALQRQLRYTKSGFGRIFDPVQVSENYDYIAIPAANWLSGRNNFIGQLAERIEQTDVPCLVVGLGAQSLDRRSFPTLDRDALRFLKVVSERSKVISARGEYSADVMERYGVKNVVATGCPSFFRGLEPRIEIAKPKKNRLAVAFNASRQRVIRADIDRFKRDVEREFYRWAFENDDCFIVPQTEAFEIGMSLGIALDEIPEDSIRDFKNFYAPGMREQDIDALRGKFETFTRVTEWMKALSRVDFVIGTRLHGCLMGLAAGIPSLLVTIDSRTREVAELFRIPTIRIQDVKLPLDVRRLYDAVELSAMMREYPNRFRIFREFLDVNEVEHNLALDHQDFSVAAGTRRVESTQGCKRKHPDV